MAHDVAALASRERGAHLGETRERGQDLWLTVGQVANDDVV